MVSATEPPTLPADSTTLVVSSYADPRKRRRAVHTYGIVRALVADGPVDLLHTGFGADAPDPAYWRLTACTCMR